MKKLILLLALMATIVIPAPIHDAAKLGDVAAIQNILIQDPSQVNAQDENGFTPLHLAAGDRHMAAVTALLRAGASKEITNDDGQLPLHLAADGDTEILSALITPANLHVRDMGGNTPLHIAAWSGNSENVQTFLGTDARDEKDAANNEGFTPLHYAAYRGCGEIIQVLIDAGANIEANQNNELITPLHIAAGTCEEFAGPEAAHTLISAGANIHARDSKQLTPLHYAVGAACYLQLLVDSTLEMVENDLPENALALLNAGADLTVQDEENRTPLMFASLSRNNETMQLLNDWPVYQNAIARRRQSLLAFCLAQKPRLGVAFPVQSCPREIFQWIGKWVALESNDLDTVYAMAQEERDIQSRRTQPGLKRPNDQITEVNNKWNDDDLDDWLNH